MSTRAMGRYYASQGGGNDIAYTGAPGLLSSLFGQDKIQGGPTIDPLTGQTLYMPYKGSSGIFGSASRRKAEDLNQQIMMSKYISEMMNQMEMQRLAEEHKSRLAEIEADKQARSSLQTEGSKLKRGESKLDSRLKRKEGRAATFNKIAEAAGVVPNKGSRKFFEQNINPERQGAAFKESQVTNEAMDNDAIRNSFMQAILDKNLAQGAMNANRRVANIGQGGTITGLGSTDQTLWNPASDRQDIVSSTDPLTGLTNQKIIRTPTMPYAVPKVDPSLRNQVLQEEQDNQGKTFEITPGSIFDPTPPTKTGFGPLQFNNTPQIGLPQEPAINLNNLRGEEQTAPPSAQETPAPTAAKLPDPTGGVVPSRYGKRPPVSGGGINLADILNNYQAQLGQNRQAGMNPIMSAIWAALLPKSAQDALY